MSSLTLSPPSSPVTRGIHSTHPSSNRPPPDLARLKELKNEGDHRLAREWMKGFTVNDIPKTGYEVTFARSSGPGGQHVNKTNTKAVLRCPLQSALGSWLPRYVLAPLSKSPHYLPSPPTLLISSQTTRSSSDNLSHALTNLHRTLLSAATAPIMGETSPEQKQRVHSLVSAEKSRRRMLKDKQKSLKENRRGV